MECVFLSVKSKGQARTLRYFNEKETNVKREFHFRNLLVSKDKLTINLLEVSEKVKTRFVEQSDLFSSKLLIDGLAEIGDTDVRYKSSKNQRLHVELALMKLSSLTAIEGEKKKQLTPLGNNTT